MNYTIWAVDDGYGDLKCATNDKFFHIPSYCTRYQPKHRNEFESNNQEEMFIAIDDNGRKYIIGDYAITQASNISWMGGSNKHTDKNFPRLFKSCLGMMTNEQNVDIDMLVMGLPVHADEDYTRHELLQQLVLKAHIFKITNDDKIWLQRNITIKNLIIKKQPFGSLCNVILNDEGDIIEKEIAKGFNVIVDIGARTLNIYTCEALDMVRELTINTNNGIYTAYQDVANFIESELHFNIPSGKLPYIIKKKKIKNTDLTEVIYASYEDLSNKIKTVIETLFIDSWGFIDRFIFTGGGSELLKQWLEVMFLDKNNLFLDRYATVKGLRKYGIRQMKKSLEGNNKRQVTITAQIGSNYYEQ